MSIVFSFLFDSLWRFITKCDRHYYKMQQLFYYKMRQKFITKCVRFFITKRAVILQNATVITKCVRFFITQCGSFITKWDSYYKMRRVLQIATVHPRTGCDYAAHWHFGILTCNQKLHQCSSSDAKKTKKCWKSRKKEIDTEKIMQYVVK